MKRTNRPEWIFCVSLLLAFLTHCSMFFGGALGVNEDNFAVKKISSNAGYGRWVCDVLYRMGIPGSYLAQAWIGIFIILGLAVLCTVVLSMVKVKNIGSAVLIMAVLISFPTLSYGYGYLSDAVFYAFSLMFAALAVYCTNRWKHGWAAGAVLIMLSLGLYQAWLSFAAAFAIFSLIVQLKEKEWNQKQMMSLLLRHAAMGVLGTVFYLLSVKIYNKIFDVTLYSYKGLNEMGQIPFMDLIGRILNCYRTFGRYLLGEIYYMPVFVIVFHMLILIVCFLRCMQMVIGRIKMKKYFDAMLFALLFTALPIGMCLMDVAAGSNDSLSIYAICLFYVFFIWLCEDLTEKYKKIAVRGVAVISIGIVGCFYFLTQVYYFKIHIFYQRTYALANRIVMRIEELEEYPGIRKVAVCSALAQREDYVSDVMFDDVILNDRGLGGQYVGFNSYYTDYGIIKFVSLANGFLGSNFEGVTVKEVLPVLKTEEYGKMTVWPHKDSVKVIDDIIFVKMEDFYWIDTEKTEDGYEFHLQSYHKDEQEVYYVWQLFRDGVEIANNIRDSDRYKVILNGPGAYHANVYVKDAETGKILHKGSSDKIIAEENYDSGKISH